MGIPSLVLWCAEGWMYESLIVSAGYIGVEDQAAQAVCATVSTIVFMCSSGFADASSTLVGNSIGHPDMRVATDRARHFSSMISFYTVVFSGMTLVPLFVFID